MLSDTLSLHRLATRQGVPGLARKGAPKFPLSPQMKITKLCVGDSFEKIRGIESRLIEQGKTVHVTAAGAPVLAVVFASTASAVVAAAATPLISSSFASDFYEPWEACPAHHICTSNRYAWRAFLTCCLRFNASDVRLVVLLSLYLSCAYLSSLLLSAAFRFRELVLLSGSTCPNCYSFRSPFLVVEKSTHYPVLFLPVSQFQTYIFLSLSLSLSMIHVFLFSFSLHYPNSRVLIP